MSDDNHGNHDGHIEIEAFGERVRLRPPTVGEFDLPCVQRLHAQLEHHMVRMDGVEPDDPGATMRIDRSMRLALMATEEIARRVRACLAACACAPVDCPEVTDDTAALYLSVAAALVEALGARARLGESRPLSG